MHGMKEIIKEASMSDEKDIAASIIAIERAALDRWGKGDPSGYLEISASDVVYFDPFVVRRLDGLVELAKYYETLRGKIRLDRYKLVNPSVQVCGDAAVFTFNLVSYVGRIEMRWNCTEVFLRKKDCWRIVQTHWSITEAGKDKVEVIIDGETRF